jgi:hypothetical protein
MDMSEFVAPKSDQLNSDDLIAGPRTIRITKVKANEGSKEQPINVYFDGDDGKPYRPCLSMRRVMIAVWGPDASHYIGRSMTLYRDPSVTWGGLEVGGIRISHLSHIEREMTMALTATKKARKPYTVKPLVVQSRAAEPAPADRVQAGVDALLADIAGAEDVAALLAVVDASLKQRTWLEKNRPDLHETVAAALRERHDRLADANVPQ